MGRHLTDRDVHRVLQLLDGWKGALTWDSLVEACAKRIGVRSVRQTLYRSVRIREAYELAKERSRSSIASVPLPSSLAAAAERIQRLEAENTRLRKENDGLLEQFVVWQYNAHVKGMTECELNSALPKVDLGVSPTSGGVAKRD